MLAALAIFFWAKNIFCRCRKNCTDLKRYTDTTGSIGIGADTENLAQLLVLTLMLPLMPVMAVKGSFLLISPLARESENPLSDL